MSSVKNILKTVLDENLIYENEPMSRHTSFRTGGNARWFVTPKTEEQVAQLCKVLSDYPHMVMGNGSNLLFTDGGYDGIVVSLGGKFSDIDVNGNEITAQSGALLSKVAQIAYKNGLGGMEFASGIPGSVGGAVFMNAGAYGGEMKDIVSLSYCVGESGKILEIKDHEFSYRHSIFSDKNLIILKTVLLLMPNEKSKIKSKTDELNRKRREKQPLEYPSAGSTFKRPEGYFAGRLIQDAGLMGYKIGGAMVSDKHAGFIINYDNATASDILRLMDYVKSKVYMQFGVELEPEIKIVGKE
ncbi:MAG: UDP-N-acetylmuramate dehydrogenase [Clostridia bacterium]|nr:UDP-N-acetylmuramate dehydrogenase [Clostridia bacterium]